MCGIVGMLDRSRSRTPEQVEQVIHRMADAMIARGPDGSGIWTDEASGIAFGHRRLAVVDLSEHGVQPMQSADRRYVVTYNGEIYNHLDLVEQLQSKGIRFRGHSDTEVLVEAIALWGLADTLERIDGMFAFALWDNEKHELTLVRDRLGEKPLYYGAVGNEVVFGSSLDSLRNHPKFDQPIDRDALALFFRHKYVPAPWTIYQGIKKLEPGHSIVISASGQIGDPLPYWSLTEVVRQRTTYEHSPAEAVDQLDHLIRRSVNRRMIADVPVGAFLSGGIDSVTIVAAAQAESSTPVRTFTIGSTEKDFDESTEARAIAKHLGTDHTELVVTDSDALSVVNGLAAIYDEPFADSSQIPTTLVSELARRSVTVALSGDAGDELFGGYNRYLWAPPIWSKLSRVPPQARRAGVALGKRIPPSAWDRAARLLPERRRPQQLGLKVAKVLDVADAGSGEEIFHRLTSHWMNPTQLVSGSVEPPTWHTDSSRWAPIDSLAEHMMFVDSVTYLPDDILAKVDRAAMSVSLESRVPYLDRDIVEFAVRLPLSMKIHDGISKWPLRQVLNRYVPEEMMDRPKAGFGLPIDSWLRGSLRSWADDLLHSPAVTTLDTKLLATTWSDHLSGRRNNAYLLWDVLMFADWCQHRGIEPADD